MKNYYSGLLLRIAFAVVALAALMSPCATTVMAQSAPPRPNPQQRETDLGRRQAEIRGLGITTSGRSGQEFKLERVNSNFDLLKGSYEEILRIVFGSDPVDYHRVSEIAKKVNGCSTQLKSDLSLPAPKKAEKDQKGKAEPEMDQVKVWLRALGDLIESFVTNPVFKSTNQVDTQLAAQAGRDLAEIIKLSEEIRKGAEKGARPTANSR